MSSILNCAVLFSVVANIILILQYKRETNIKSGLYHSNTTIQT